MYKISITHSFDKELQRFLDDHQDQKDKISKTFKELLTDPDHPALRTHKLENLDSWSISVDMATRITFKIDSQDIIFLHIGNHDQVYG